MNNATNGFKNDYIIGIGASAGGLEAIHEMFDNMRDGTNFSFVIIQHLSSDHKSLMGELLSKHTNMKVFEASDGLRLESNCIYLIPNKFMMSVKNRKLRLHEKGNNHVPNNAIDIFFESLAEDVGDKAVGIVLSGTGTDGTKGIEAIKTKGGVVVVQDPMSAKFDGMPNSAIATGYADLILSPDMIPDEMLDFLQQAPLIRSFNEQNLKEEHLVNGILEMIKLNSSYDFRDYKKPTIYRRLAKRMAEVNVKSLPEYVTYLKNNPEEPKKIGKEFLIGVTKFFRDMDAFEQLKTSVLPTLFKKSTGENGIKVWVVACSTGEEAYSIAILLQEYMNTHKLPPTNIKIFATDIDNESLEIASRGLYPSTIVNDVPEDLLSTYFNPEGNQYRVSPAIRKMVVFAHHNVMSDPPFSRMDLVSCRNMLIYMNPQLQKDILKAFHFALNVDGFLILGPSENIGLLKDAVTEIDRKWKIYQCVMKSAQAYSTVFNSLVPGANGNNISVLKPKNALNDMAEIFKQTLLEEQNYAGIFIDKDLEIKQATGNFKNFLDFPEGNFNFSLLKLVHPELATPLSIAIRKSIKDNERVTVNNIKIVDGKNIRVINVIIKPYLVQKNYLQPFLFIILHEQNNIPKEKVNLSTSAGFTDVERFAEMEKELSETRENLQALIEEVESANEELQTSNEEILSSNEELQSTNEELQSLNEELHTVNAEHQLKIKELVELNDDLNNYFRNSDIGQVIIDKKLIIRKFSPAATKQINLIETDIGRSIIDISNNFKNLDFINNIKSVLQSGQSQEKEVLMGNDTVYLMKLNPYLRLDRSIDGVVISFVDITEVKKLDSILTAVFNSSPSGIAAKKAVRNNEGEIIDFEYLMMNVAAMELMHLRGNDLAGKTMREVFPSLNKDYLQRLIDVVITGKPAQFEYFVPEHGQWFEIVCVKMLDGLVTTFTDITEKKQSADLLAKGYEDLKTTSQILQKTNEQLEVSNMDLYQFASIASHDLKEPLRKIQAFGNLLHDKVKEKIDANEKNYLDKIIRSSARMHTLIEDVLTFSKLSNTEFPLVKTNLTNVVKTVIDDLEISIHSKNAEINIGELPVIYAVPPQMQQVFHNLISNALKFNDDKPVIHINEEAITPQMEKKLRIDAAKFVGVSVRDNGIGFKEEFGNKIFKMFQRLDKTNYEGTGIGLAICKKIIENHGGHIIAESELDKGSKFTLLFPRKENNLNN